MPWVLEMKAKRSNMGEVWVRKTGRPIAVRSQSYKASKPN
jgi:hypothetical protein